jgi:hypothetical protein
VANLGALAWLYEQPKDVVYSKPATDPGIPGLVLRKEYLQLERGVQRLPANACWRIGPFQTENQMQIAWKALEYIALDMQHSKTINRVSRGYLLSIPPSTDFNQAQKIIRKLTNVGITDAYIYKQGIMANAIFVGQYEQLEMAQARLMLVQAQGFEVELKNIQSETPQWWIKATVRDTLGFLQWQKEFTPAVAINECL